MEEYLSKNVKEVISSFPGVGKALERHSVGCVDCSAATCLLKDVIDIHNLAEEETHSLMAEIAAVIYPGREVKIPEIKKKPRSAGGGWSPPIKRLVEEHKLIKRFIGTVPDLIENFRREPTETAALIREGIDFIRGYADRRHHAKEEEILFKYFDPELEIIKTMLFDHDIARGHVKALEKALEDNDAGGVEVHLSAYRDLLLEHIKKEDEILYPWMDRNLATTQVGELFSRFEEADAASGGVSEKGHNYIERLEERFQGRSTANRRKDNDAV